MACSGPARRQPREHAQPVGVDPVELDRPVVPAAVGLGLQLVVGDAQTHHRGAVDHRRRDAVAVHVLEPQGRVRRPEPVLLDATAFEAGLRRRRVARDPEDRAVARPTCPGRRRPRRAGRVPGPSRASASVQRSVGTDGQVHVVVAGVQRPVDLEGRRCAGRESCAVIVTSFPPVLSFVVLVFPEARCVTPEAATAMPP